jgi:hypothetical protein
METPELFPQNPSSPSAAPDAHHAAVQALRQECQDLRRLFNATFVALLFLLLGVNVFFFKQMRLVQYQVEEQRPVVLRAETEFYRNRHPEISQFLGRLQGYAASHRDFQSNVIDRYRTALPQYLHSGLPQAVNPAAGGQRTVPAPGPR